jgi:N-acetylmuramoyl-L-alanine amidase
MSLANAGSGIKSFMPDSRYVNDVVPAANHEPRRGVKRPNMLVLHYTGMASAARAIRWLAVPESRVSCHYVIDEAGRVTQMVPERLRAWHAGVSCWQGETDLNSASVGIEIQNPGHEDGYHDFPAAQIAAVIAVSQDIVERHDIPAPRVLAHSDIAPMRKIDPGEKFPWQLLADAGLGAWVPASPIAPTTAGLAPGDHGASVAAAQAMFADYGYYLPTTATYDTLTEHVVRAFQRHFRPTRCDGRLDLSTLATLERLVAAYGQRPAREPPRLS